MINPLSKSSLIFLSNSWISWCVYTICLTRIIVLGFNKAIFASYLCPKIQADYQSRVLCITLLVVQQSALLWITQVVRLLVLLHVVQGLPSHHAGCV